MADVMTMLKQDHREVERMLAELEQTEEGPQRASMVEEIRSALMLHMQIEENIVYPYVPRVLGREEGEEAFTEHALAREGLEKLQAMVEEPGFGAAVAMLAGGITHHVQDEETDVLPGLKRGLDREEWRELSERVEEAKAAAGRPFEPSRATGSSKRGTAKRGTAKRGTAKRGATKSAAKKTTARASAARKTTAKKSTAKKSAAKKSTARSRSTASRRRG
jgi:hemerythrin-like domain-containing protein